MGSLIKNVGLFFLSMAICSAAELEEFLKKAEGKSDRHKMRNIDFIYMINLDQRPEKFEQSCKELYSYGIEPYRFSAVNGWELSFEAINAVGVKFTKQMRHDLWGTSYLPEDHFMPRHEVMSHYGQTYFGHCQSRGAIGIVLSHLSVLQDAYDAGYETIWVMEDDIQVIQNPQVLPDLVDKLDSLVGHDGWDILFTDQDTKNQQGGYVSCYAYCPRPNFSPVNPKGCLLRRRIHKDFQQIGARYGAYSMIVRRSGMEKLLSFLKQYKIFIPYDMEYTLPPGIRLFTVLHDVVSTLPKALSDNAGPNYDK